MPTPTATPLPVTVHLQPDGGGDYGSLADAVRDAPDEATIVLAAGTYVLKETLVIDRPLLLEGAGMDETVVFGPDLAVVARFTGSGRFGAQDLTFRSEGDRSSDVVVADGGDVYFARCRFTGATAGRDAGGAGLLVMGDTTGMIRDSVADFNDIGIRLTDQVRPNVEWNLATDNASAGIAYQENATGIATRNECSHGQIGILIEGSANPAIHWNLCTDNSIGGIVYRDDAAGTATDNECVWNGVHGITVADHARPELTGNVCTDNGGAGIFYKDDAGGTASENETWRNLYGVQLSGRSNPDIRKNWCVMNEEAGILYADDSGGLAYRNECRDNGKYGLWVAVTASPILDGNDLYDNQEQDLLDLRP
ncbi:MAG: hypothetical protein E3J64_09610 [Anaerolineales bacterium]|nr:MAG: hypothetical protein E3J64_09610 [Anaerolineales bacterium]